MTLREIFSGIGSYFNKAASGVLDFDLTPLIIIFLSIGIVYFHLIENNISCDNNEANKIL